MEPYIDQHLKDWFAILRTHYAQPRKTCNLSPQVHFFTFDVTSELSVGKPFGFIKKQGDVNGYINSLHIAFPFFNVTGNWPMLAWVMQTRIVNYLFAPSAADKEGFGHLRAVCSTCVEV
jgi:hypothetical protein